MLIVYSATLRYKRNRDFQEKKSEAFQGVSFPMGIQQTRFTYTSSGFLLFGFTYGLRQSEKVAFLSRFPTHLIRQ